MVNLFWMVMVVIVLVIGFVIFVVCFFFRVKGWFGVVFGGFLLLLWVIFGMVFVIVLVICFSV